MEDRIERAGYVLPVCTDLYWNKVRQKVPNDVGHGVYWEANLIYNALYLGKLNRTKFVPVVFTDSEKSFIPNPFEGPRASCAVRCRRDSFRAGPREHRIMSRAFRARFLDLRSPWALPQARC
jgi:hypothetical protein